MGILERMQCSIQQGLIRDMKQEFIRLTDQGNITEYSSDSGMEDGAISPVSSVDSEIDVCRNKSPSGSDVVQSHPIPLVKPQVLTPSESSAFSKIDKWTPTYTPSLASFPPVCSTSAVGYLPGFFISPWIAESFQRGYQLPPAPMMYGSPDTSPSKSSDEMLRSPESVTDKIIQSPEKHAFYHVDPRIPFTNYFMNLTKLLQKDDDATKNKQDQKKSTSDDKIGDTRKDECFRYSDRLSETKNRSPSPVLMTPELEDSKEDTKELVAPEPVPHIDHLRAISMEATPKTIMPAQSDLFPVPGSLDRLGPYPPLAPSTSMMPIMGGMGLTPSSGMFHPAFLQMAGIGGKRAHHADKPTPVKKYKCDVCGKAFSRSNTLVTHKRIHTGDKPFKCEVCSRAFRQPGNLTRHRLTHTTVKPYVCPQCNKAFNRASNLHTHMRTHTNYKPFVCPYCGKGFHQKIDMKIHCYTHTGQRPHRCDVCGKGFTLASTLSTHRRIHFDTRSFPATSFPASASVVSN